MSYRNNRGSGKHSTASHVVRHGFTPVSESGSKKNVPPEENAKQTRLYLEEPGVIYLSLALYLSSRIDLLPAEFCHELSLIPDRGPSASFSELQQTLCEELPHNANSIFVHPGSTAIHSTLLTHSFHATLMNGAPVTVVILRPECRALRSGPVVPPSFDKSIAQKYCTGAVDDAVLLDFFSCLRRKCDFRARLECELEGSGCDAVLSCQVYPELTTSRIITAERIDGSGIGELRSDDAHQTELLARRICQAWFHQALFGNGFAVDPQPDNVIFRDNALFFNGCDVVRLPASAKENLWNYLMAAMIDDPDRAARYLLREMYPPEHKQVSSEAFRSMFRQSAIFGALAPLIGTNTDGLAQVIFQHWKTALEFGYEPKPHLLCFYRGLFSVARISYMLSPLADNVQVGIEDVRAARIAAQFEDLADWRYWFQNSDKFASVLVNLPKIVDDALARTAEPTYAATEPHHRGDHSSHSSAHGSMLCVLLALLVLLQSLSMNPWAHKTVLLLLLLAGFILLGRSDKDRVP